MHASSGLNGLIKLDFVSLLRKNTDTDMIITQQVRWIFDYSVKDNDFNDHFIIKCSL